MDYIENQLDSHIKVQQDFLQSFSQDDSRINRSKLKLFFSEFLGTFIFVYLAQSSLTSLELTGIQNDIINRQTAILLCNGLSFILATFLTISTSGAHLNPAYTFACASFNRINWSLAFNYISAQYSGSFLASIFLHATYNDKLNQRHNEGISIGMNTTLRAHGHILSTGKFFTSFPPTEVSLIQLSISYLFATAHLMLVLIAIHESIILKLPTYVKPIYLAIALVLFEAAFSANGGPVLNPAQDFSPRLYISMFGWGSAAFNLYNFRYWWLATLIVPHLGALLGFGIYRLLLNLNSLDYSSNVKRRNYSETRVLDF